MVKINKESRVSDGEIIVDGVPIEEIIENFSFEQLIFHMLQKRKPSENEKKLLRAYLVSLCEHGNTAPSALAARVPASVNSPFEMGVISFLATAAGDYHFGALRKCMEHLKEISEKGLDVEQYVDEKLNRREKIFGFGHRVHKKNIDPRSKALFDFIDKIGFKGKYILLVKQLDEVLHKRKGIRVNIDGVGAGILLDLGFSESIAPLFVFISRMISVAKIFEEEQSSPDISPYIGLVKRERKKG